MNWVEFDRVSLGYGHQSVVEEVSFALPVGSSIGLAGPNGAGKTTVLKAMLGLLPVKNGRITRDPVNRRATGYVPQRGTITEVFPFTLEEIVEMGLYGKIRPWAAPNGSHAGMVRATLERLGLATFADKQFRDLSGGQKQRALLARALVSEPGILVLDEPTYGLDLAQTQSFFELLSSFRKERSLSLIIVSHNLRELIMHCEHLLLLHQGRLAYSGPANELSDELLSRIYGMDIRLQGDNPEGIHG